MNGMHDRHYDLQRTLAPSQQFDWHEVPFEVPSGTREIRVRCTLDGYAFAGEVVDLGVRDAERVRGWSGGARDSFVLGQAHATPGYLPGALRPGPWAVILASNRLPDQPVTVRLAVDCVTEQPRWLSGDLHTHTVHSDGTFELGEALALAAGAGLDFIGLTDHNTTSQNSAAGSHPPLAIIPGLELTTYRGHLNLLGAPDPLPDFRVRDEAELHARLAQARLAGARIVLNHPHDPNCGWQYDWDIPFDWIEVWNGPWRPSNQLSLQWWQARLVEGRRLVAVCGSDVHRPHQYIKHGWPAASVWSGAATADAILDAIGRGHLTMSFAPFGPRAELRTGDAQAGDEVESVAELSIAVERAEAGDRVMAVTERGVEKQWDVETNGRRWESVWQPPPRRFYRLEVWRHFPQVDMLLVAALTNPLYVAAS